MFRTQDFAISFSQSAQTLDIQCSFIYLNSLTVGGVTQSSGRVLVGLPNGGGDVMLMVGQGFKLPQDIKQFSIKTMNSGSSVAGQLLIGDGEFMNSRINGIVSVTDAEREKVGLGYAMRGIVSQAGGGTGGAVAQIFNPGASLKNLYLNSMRLGASAADTWSIFSTSTQAPTLVGAVLNLDRSLASGASATRSGNDATAYAAMVSYATGYIGASSDLLVEFPRPVLIKPGFGVAVQFSTLATNLRCTFDAEEWPFSYIA